MRKLVTLVLFVMILVLALPVAAPASSSGPGADAWIITTLLAVMENDGRLDLRQIDVASADGRVTLNGTVLTPFEYALAERLAAGIPGVAGVVNTIRVIPAVTPDMQLAQAARQALLENPSLRVAGLSVHAQNGTVVISGMAFEPGQKLLANRILAWLPDITRVQNQIRVVHESVPRTVRN